MARVLTNCAPWFDAGWSAPQILEHGHAGAVIVLGDCLESLRRMSDGSVQMCVTSPPYFGLRSYLPGVVRINPDLPDNEKAALLQELQKRGILPRT